MDEPRTWTRADKAGAILLGLLAIGLGLIAADILMGGRLFTLGHCCDEEEATIEP
jgi:hypothetical protein